MGPENALCQWVSLQRYQYKYVCVCVCVLDQIYSMQSISFNPSLLSLQKKAIMRPRDLSIINQSMHNKAGVVAARIAIFRTKYMKYAWLAWFRISCIFIEQSQINRTMNSQGKHNDEIKQDEN